MPLEQRLGQIEKKLKPLPKGPKYEPQYMDLFDFPKETVVTALGVLKDVTGDYQCILKLNQIENANLNEYIALNHLTPAQLYDLMVTSGGLSDVLRP